VFFLADGNKKLKKPEMEAGKSRMREKQRVWKLHFVYPFRAAFKMPTGAGGWWG